MTIKPPPERDVLELKRLAAGIIRAQGNRFIKELLRSKKIPIGKNKNDFERNLNEAIESGKLILSDVDSWLKLVEGWGNQHVYLYNLTSSLRKDLTQPKIQGQVKEKGFSKVWNGKTVNTFPDKPKLTSISFRHSVFQLQWQEVAQGWTAVADKNYKEVEGLDTFEYRAYRRLDDRAITRFEAHLDFGLAALFVAKPIADEEHKNAIREARHVIGQLIDLSELDRGQVDISTVCRNLDQQNVPTNSKPNPEIRTQKSRLASGGAYIEFAANSKTKAYWEESVVKDVRNSIRTTQLSDFQGEDGVFVFQESSGTDGLNRPLRVQLIGKDARIRLWAQMTAHEVWTILIKLGNYQ